MTEEKILEGNRLIGLFLGMEHVNDAPLIYPGGYYVSEDTNELDLPRFVEQWEFHTSWDWLMPVLKKINFEYNITIANIADENIQYCEIISNIHDDLLQITWVESRIDKAELIEVVYAAVINFIKWYNTEKDA